MSKTIYINEKTGNDAHDGLTPETALLTPQEAASRMTAGEPLTLDIVWDGEKWCIKKRTNGKEQH